MINNKILHNHRFTGCLTSPTKGLVIPWLQQILILKNHTTTLATKSSLALVHTSSLTPAPLHPWFITGFVDGDGCFFVSIQSSPNSKLKERVKLIFQLVNILEMNN